MNEEIKFSDIPIEVQEVWAISIAGYSVGLDTWNRCNAIIKKYPEYFPWQHKYDSIPKEVHEAYEAEAFPPFEFTNEGRKEFIGIIPTVLDMPESVPPTSLTLSEMFSELFKQEKERRDMEEVEYKKQKAIWDKYYSPYGLEYRK